MSPTGICASEEPVSRPDKRPFALTSALILSLFFGFSDVGKGCGRMALYRLAGQGPSMEEMAVGSAEERANVLAAFANYVTESEAARSLVIPLSAAAIVLGIGALFFTLRAFARVPGSRNMLWQLVLAQTALVIGSHFALPRLRAAETAREAAVQRARLSELPAQDQANAEKVLKMMPAMQDGFTGIRAMLGVLIVIVLNRKSTREYYEATQPSSERG